MALSISLATEDERFVVSRKFERYEVALDIANRDHQIVQVLDGVIVDFRDDRKHQVVVAFRQPVAQHAADNQFFVWKRRRFTQTLQNRAAGGQQVAGASWAQRR